MGCGEECAGAPQAPSSEVCSTSSAEWNASGSGEGPSVARVECNTATGPTEEIAAMVATASAGEAKGREEVAGRNAGLFLESAPTTAGTALAPPFENAPLPAAGTGPSSPTERLSPLRSTAHETEATSERQTSITAAPTVRSIGATSVSPSAHPPPYLAAGVLPFCVLGGDLLFLLGQQLRFRSRAKGSASHNVREGSASGCRRTGGNHSARGGVGDTSWGRRGEGLGKSAGTGQKAIPVRKPRHGPRPKLSPAVSVQKIVPEAVLTGHTRTQQRDVANVTATFNAGETAPPRKEGADSQSMSCHDIHDGHVSPGNSSGEGITQTSTGMLDTATSTTTADYIEQRCENQSVAPTQAESKLPADSTVEVPLAGALDEPVVLSARDVDQVPAGLLWSDFGGGIEEGDGGAEGTASREFAEESFGLFNGVRLASDSVARSQATMESALRNPFLRGKRVFECRNGGYVMFIAEVDFVPDIMMKLARKEIVDGDGENGDSSSISGSGDSTGGDVAVGDSAAGSECEGAVSPSIPGFSEKTDFAWVPASSLLKALRESRNRSTRNVVVKLGGCRYLRLFHKFVISLWGMDLAAVIKAASRPLDEWKSIPLSSPRVLLLKPATSTRHRSSSDADRHVNLHATSDHNLKQSRKRTLGVLGNQNRGARREDADVILDRAGLVITRCAIRGEDCIRPTFLSGRKRTSLGIIDERSHHRRATPPRWASECGSEDVEGSGVSVGTESLERTDEEGFKSHEGSDEGGRQSGGRSRNRGKRSGAACRKRRRQCKEARRRKAAAAGLSPMPVIAVRATATAVSGAAGGGVSSEAAEVVDTSIPERS